MYDTALEHGPQEPGGRYFCGYWAHEYTVDAMWTLVYRAGDDTRWIPGPTWYAVTWVPSEDATHPRQSPQWRGEGYRRGTHCTNWDAQRDEIVAHPA